jgi:hypothetical protein
MNEKSCKRRKYCDKVAYGGRDLRDMKNDLPDFIKEMRKFNSSTVIILEGANSLGNMEFGRIREYLDYIVENLHKSGAKVYVAELPLGISGHCKSHSEKRVRRYNSLIREVGADGIVELAQTPWYRGQVHGYKPHTFKYMMEKFDEAVYSRPYSPDYRMIPRKDGKK